MSKQLETETITIKIKYDDIEVRDLVLDEIVKKIKDGFSSGFQDIDDMDYSFECDRASWYGPNSIIDREAQNDKRIISK